MNKLILSFCLLLAATFSQAQEYFTRTAHINVESTNDIHDVEANNYQVYSQLNPTNGDLTFTALLKSFEFKVGALNRMMNSRKLNVTQYPKITYEGKITDIHTVNFDIPGTYNVTVEGTLYIWDEKRITSAKGQLIVNDDGTVGGSSIFNIKIEEKNVGKVNTIMRDKLPSIMNIDTNTLGISRDIHIEAYMYYNQKRS